MINVPNPSKNGYVFAGWTPQAPVTMPEQDVTLTASWTVRDASLHTLRYLVDGAVYKSYQIRAGADIPKQPFPTKEYSKFSGWSRIPDRMPDNDYDITGSFGTGDVDELEPEGGSSSGTYKLTYWVTWPGSLSAEKYKERLYKQGDRITVEASPATSGQTFSGWSPAVPSTMPAQDLSTYGTVSVPAEMKVYIIYYVNGAEWTREEHMYGDTITKKTAHPEPPTNYDFSGWDWRNWPSNNRMPNHNVEVYGYYTVTENLFLYTNLGWVNDLERGSRVDGYAVKADPTRDYSEFDELVIPEYIKVNNQYCPVVKFSKDAFSGRDDVKKIVVPKTFFCYYFYFLRTEERGVFYEYTRVSGGEKWNRFRDQLIPPGCFKGCTNLEEVDFSSLENYLTQLDLKLYIHVSPEAFMNCSKLTTPSFVSNPNGPIEVLYYGDYCFANCALVTGTVHIPGGHISPAKNGQAYADYPDHEKERYYNDVDNHYCYENWFRDTGDHIRNNVACYIGVLGRTASLDSGSKQYLSEGAFMNSGITAVNGHGNGVQLWMFKGCTSLTTVANVWLSDISVSSFDGCTSLNSVSCTADTATIGSYCFDGCTSLEVNFATDIPNMQNVLNCAFRGCTRLGNININPTSQITTDPEICWGAFENIGTAQARTFVTHISKFGYGNTGGSSTEYTGQYNYDYCLGGYIIYEWATSQDSLPFDNLKRPRNTIWRKTTDTASPARTPIGNTKITRFGFDVNNTFWCHISPTLQEHDDFGGTVELIGLDGHALSGTIPDNMQMKASHGWAYISNSFTYEGYPWRENFMAGCTGVTEVCVNSQYRQTKNGNISWSTEDGSLYNPPYYTSADRNAFGTGCFSGCTALAKVTIKSWVGGEIHVPCNAFNGCTSLQNVWFESAQTLDGYNSNLTKIKFIDTKSGQSKSFEGAMTFHINDSSAEVTLHKSIGTGPYTYEVLVADFSQKDIVVYICNTTGSTEDLTSYINTLRTYTNSSANSYTASQGRMPNYPNNN